LFGQLTAWEQVPPPSSKMVQRLSVLLQDGMRFSLCSMTLLELGSYFDQLGKFPGNSLAVQRELLGKLLGRMQRARRRLGHSMTSRFVAGVRGRIIRGV
jgi:hypothetical protein